MTRARLAAIAVASALAACGGSTELSPIADDDASVARDAGATDASDASEDGAIAPGTDAGLDASATLCTYDDGGLAFDAAGRFHGACANGCPPGTICAVEIGGPAGGGGEYCAPIPDECRANLTCACLASCVCGSSFGRPEACSDPSDASAGALSCDNGVR